jgi:hypothetical protein
MFKPNKITKILGATFVLVSSNSVLAQETESTNATVTVLNAFAFDNVDDLDIGTVRAANNNSSDGNFATFDLLADGTTASSGENNGAIIQLIGTPGTPASFTIAGVTAFAQMAVTFPSTATTLFPASAAPTSANFLIPAGLANSADMESGGFTVAVRDALIPTADADAATGIAKITADGAGAAAFTVGARIQTVPSASRNYTDEAYTGTFTISVDY